MNKVELARRLARLSGRSRAQAADKVDALVYDLLTKAKAASDKGNDGHPPEAISSAPREKH